MVRRSRSGLMIQAKGPSTTLPHGCTAHPCGPSFRLRRTSIVEPTGARCPWTLSSRGLAVRASYLCLNAFCCGCFVNGWQGFRLTTLVMPCVRKARRMVAAHTRMPQRRCNSSAISCKLARARSVTMSCNAAICCGLSAGGLPPAWTSVRQSCERFVAMAWALHTGVRHRRPTFNFVYTHLGAATGVP